MRQIHQTGRRVLRVATATVVVTAALVAGSSGASAEQVAAKAGSSAERAPTAAPSAMPNAVPKAGPNAVPKAGPNAVPTAVPNAVPKPGPMRVSGRGGGVLGEEWGDFAGDPVSFQVRASATDPLRPDGTFHVVHLRPDGGLRAEFSGRVTSLYAVDEVAVLTGRIDRAQHPGIPLEFVGKDIALTVYDGRAREDRIGWAWGFFGAPVSRVQGTAPHFPLTWGGFAVRGGPGQQSTARPDQRPDQQVGLRTDRTGTTVLAVLGGTSKAPPFQGDPLRFTVAAHIPPGGNALDVQGNFHVTHHRPDGRVVADFEGRISCLATGGPVAIATGVVTRAAAPDLLGKPVSFSLKDGRPDRIGWLWGFTPTDEPITDCQSTTPFYAPDWGGLLVS